MFYLKRRQVKWSCCNVIIYSKKINNKDGYKSEWMKKDISASNRLYMREILGYKFPLVLHIEICDKIGFFFMYFLKKILRNFLSVSWVTSKTFLNFWIFFTKLLVLSYKILSYKRKACIHTKFVLSNQFRWSTCT